MITGSGLRHGVFAWTVFSLALACGCRHGQSAARGVAEEKAAAPTPTISRADSRDDLVGWYRVIGKDLLIPVFKRGEKYYSVCRGFETPFKPSPAGLEWAFEPSSMAGTTIGRDPNTGGCYLAVFDSQAADFTDEKYGCGEKEPMTRVDPPAWLVDPATEPPRTLDDFLGWYQPLLLPGWPRWEVRKDGEGYEAIYETVDSSAKPAETYRHALVALPDRLGFKGFERSSDVALVYSADLRRFEIARGELRMPLLRILPPRADQPTKPDRPIRVGIPSWH